MIMLDLFGTGIREIKTLEDWVYCVKGMPPCCVADEESREQAKKAVKAAIKGIEETRPKKELEKAVDSIETYSNLGKVYLKAEHPHILAIGYEFTGKARKTLTGIKDKLIPTEYEKLEKLVKANEDQITLYRPVK